MELYGIREETSLSLIQKILIRAAISRNFVSGEERGRLQIVIPCKQVELVCKNRIPCESPRWVVKALHNQAQTAQAKERWNAETAMFKFNSQRTHPLDREELKTALSTSTGNYQNYVGLKDIKSDVGSYAQEGYLAN
jgi:hypothetical protein